MRSLSCATARRRLHAFHDRELAVSDQIAVAAHLQTCRACRDALADLEFLGSSLRTVAVGRATLTRDEATSFHAGVVSRVKAERDASLVARVRSLFDDMHLVYAGVGAAVAGMICVVIMLGMMRFATRERPDSLAAIVGFLATPGSNANAIAIDAASHARWTARFQAATENAEQDAVFTLAAVVTHEGRMTDLDRLRARGRTPAAEQAKLIEGLMDVVSRARLEPLQADGLPAAASMVWLVTHTTVRPSDNTHTLDLVLPAKKRAALFISSGGLSAVASQPYVVAV
jgi:hypothetical protein